MSHGSAGKWPNQTWASTIFNLIWIFHTWKGPDPPTDSPEPDVPKLHAQLLALTERFRSLTNRAHAFMRDLQSTIQLHGVSVAQFLGESNGASQAEILRARAREAIPALLFTLQSINDQRVTRSDRFTDWRTMALWFAEAPTDEDTHGSGALDLGWRRRGICKSIKRHWIGETKSPRDRAPRGWKRIPFGSARGCVSMVA